VNWLGSGHVQLASSCECGYNLRVPHSAGKFSAGCITCGHSSSGQLQSVFDYRDMFAVPRGHIL
jgi:hypothetical protein